jgi:hypothetical protein
MEYLLEDRREFVADLALQFRWKTLPDLVWLRGH